MEGDAVMSRKGEEGREERTNRGREKKQPFSHIGVPKIQSPNTSHKSAASTSSLRSLANGTKKLTHILMHIHTVLTNGEVRQQFFFLSLALSDSSVPQKKCFLSLFKNVGWVRVFFFS